MSCINLIFCTNQMTFQNMVLMLPFLTTVITNIIDGMIGIRIPLPPKYVREVLDYSKADVQDIKKSIKDFNWRKTLESLSIDSKVDLLIENF